MKTYSPNPRGKRGSSLIETVIAMGVMAISIPLVFGTIAEAGKSGISAKADTRSAWIVSACMAEIRASREGRPQYFTNTQAGQVFPPASDVWALAFGPEGQVVGKVNKATYDKGVKEVDGKAVAYIASMSSVTTTTPTGGTPMLKVKVTMEYPSSGPVAKRQKLDFFTRIP